MRIALIVPGGVDPSGEWRVIPALLALLERLSTKHDLQVFTLWQQPRATRWVWHGASVHNIGRGWTRCRALHTIAREHRVAPFELVHSMWSGACGLIAVAAGRLLGIPSLVHFTGGEPIRLPRIGFGGRLTWRGRAQEALVLRAASAVSATSAPMVELLATLGRVATRVPLGVDAQRWPAHAPLPRRPHTPARLIHVASLNRVKDQPTLLKALALLAPRIEFHLDIVGEDTLGGSIAALAAELGLARRVSFHGFLPQRQLVPLLQAAHVMVLSSLHEAGPFAMLEAALLGVPSVGTAVGHLREWSPEAALAVPVADSVALAAAIEQVLSDEALRLRLGAAAARRARQEDADHTASAFEALYRELLRPRG